MDVAGYGLSTGGVPLIIGILIFILIIPFIDRYHKKVSLKGHG